MKISSFFFLSLFFLLNIFLPPNNSIAQENQGALVDTAAITRGTLNDYQTFIGSIHFRHSSLIAAKTEGLVLRVNFDTTSQIKQGDVLVELDHEILDSRIRALRASLRELKLLEEKSSKDLQRYHKLLKQKNVSQQKYDEIYYEKSRLDQKLISQQAELEALLLEQKQTMITAPFSGVITERHVERGEWVETGGKIATLVDPDQITALFNIPAYYALNIRAGQKLTVHVGDLSLNGFVEGVIVTGDSQSRTFPLKLGLQTQQATLLDGMEARISLPRTNRKDSLLVPRDAIIKRFGQDVVFVVVDNRAKMVPVTIELYNGSMAAITAIPSTNDSPNEALAVDMRVITKGNERIFPDQSVRLK